MMNLLSEGIWSVAVVVTLSAFFLLFLIYSIVLAARKGSDLYSWFPAIASASCLMVIAADFWASRTITEYAACGIGTAAASILMGMDRESGRRFRIPAAVLLFSLLPCLSVLRAVFPHYGGWGYIGVSAYPLLASAFLVSVYCMEFVGRISDRGAVARSVSARSRISSDICGMYLYMYLFLSVLWLAFRSSSNLAFRTVSWAVLALLICLYSAGCMRILTGRLIVADARMDRKLNDLLHECMGESKDALKSDQTYRAIYDRLVAYFEEDKPYLDAGLTLNTVARKVYCNKLYLSRTISLFTGRNFCQYVNYYRIRHSVRIFEEDPSIRMNTWAELSGFRTMATFNMAFKLYMNESPGEWCRKYRMRSEKIIV